MEINRELSLINRSSISLLRFIACILITNSHCVGIYPLRYLCIGGGYGNCIFFLVSGFCLGYITSNFGEWICRRFFRIIPIYLFLLSISFFFDNVFFANNYFTVLDVLKYCINRYWFVTAILIFYPIFYFIFHFRNIKIISISLIIWFITYTFIYILHDKSYFFVEKELFSPFKVFFYFGVMIIGGYLRFYPKFFHEKTIKQNSIIIILLLLFGFLWTAEYTSIMLLSKGLTIQFLIHVSVLVFCILFFILIMSLNINLQNDSLRGRIIYAIGSSTLEIYLVQLIIRPIFQKLVFPLSLVLFYFFAFSIGILINKCYIYILNRGRKI